MCLMCFDCSLLHLLPSLLTCVFLIDHGYLSGLGIETTHWSLVGSSVDNGGWWPLFQSLVAYSLEVRGKVPWSPPTSMADCWEGLLWNQCMQSQLVPGAVWVSLPTHYHGVRGILWIYVHPRSTSPCWLFPLVCVFVCLCIHEHTHRAWEHAHFCMDRLENNFWESVVSLHCGSPGTRSQVSGSRAITH